MSTPLRIATFNLENLNDTNLAARLAVLRPQLARLRADVLCLQEIHAQKHADGTRDLAALLALVDTTPLQGHHLASTRTQTGVPYEERNLVVLSRFAIQAVEQRKNDSVRPQYRKVTALPPEPGAVAVGWERPILYTQLDLGGGRLLHVVNVHLKSRIPSDIDGQKRDRYTWRTASGWAEGFFLSSMKRVGQALEVRMLIDEIFDAEPDAWIAVCGDFNAEFNEVPLRAICGPVEETNNPDLTMRVLVPCENTIPEPSRYTLFHLGRGAMLDHVLVSRPLLAHYRGAEIHNETLPDESGAFRDDDLFPESDHAPVVAHFEIP